MNIKYLPIVLLSLAATLMARAQIQEPVKFKSEWKQLSDTVAEIVFTGTIAPGWHVYSTDLPEGGPVAATFNLDRMEGAELRGPLEARGQVTEKMDPMFGIK